MAKIYRRQRHSRDGEDSVSDDDDEGLWLLKSVFIDSVSDSIKKTELILCSSTCSLSEKKDGTSHSGWDSLFQEGLWR